MRVSRCAEVPASSYNVKEDEGKFNLLYLEYFVCFPIDMLRICHGNLPVFLSG